jgi:hypothetical protein
LVNVLNALFSALGIFFSAIFSILPNSPFRLLDSTPIAPFLSTINYFVPVSEILDILGVWIACIGVYYLYQIVLRWIKVIN